MTRSSDDILRSYAFRRERETAWKELEDLLRAIDRSGLKSLSQQELVRLPVVYRATVASLGVARSIVLDRALLDYLEALTTRAYFAVYGPKASFARALGEFFAGRFPRAVRAARWWLALTTAILVAGALIAFKQVQADGAAYGDFVAPELAQGRGPEASYEALRESLFSTEHDTDDLGTFAAYLFRHNSNVGILTFAIGVLGGLLSGVLVLQNGLMLGAFVAPFHGVGLAAEVWSWLLPHGITEMLAILLCGAAGTSVGAAIVFPGERGRAARLREKGMESGVIVVGALALFLVAGLIEGIFRQVVHDLTVRYAFAAMTAVIWTGYFCFCGRKRDS